jgi:hypothetical protein
VSLNWLRPAAFLIETGTRRSISHAVIRGRQLWVDDRPDNLYLFMELSQ